VAVIHAGQLGPARPATDWGREAIGLAMAGITGTADAAQGAHA
jgi:simple sugar transport system ATP-binding protein